MKTVFVILIALFASGQIIAQNSSAFGFSWEICPGLRNYEMIIGSDKKVVNEIYNRSQSVMTDTFYKSFIVHKHIVKPEIEKYICRYIAANCVRVDKITNKEKDIYKIGTYNGSSEKPISCIITNREDATKFFIKLKKYIENSPYKKECKYIIADLQKKFIEGKEFALTPYQRKLSKELDKKKKKRN